MNQPCKVADPARGHLNRKNSIPLSPCVPENLVSRDGFSRPVPRQPAHLMLPLSDDVGAAGVSQVQGVIRLLLGSMA